MRRTLALLMLAVAAPALAQQTPAPGSNSTTQGYSRPDGSFVLLCSRPAEGADPELFEKSLRQLKDGLKQQYGDKFIDLTSPDDDKLAPEQCQAKARNLNLPEVDITLPKPRTCNAPGELFFGPDKPLTRRDLSPDRRLLDPPAVLCPAAPVKL